MKRTQSSRNKLNHINRNIIYPNLIEPITINEMAPTIEIIEINSDGSEKKSGNDTWCHVDNKLEKNATNRKAREVRSLKYEENYAFGSTNKDESSTDNDDSNSTFNSHCGGGYDRDEETFYNHVKYIKIINNNLKSDTSSEDGHDIEIMHSNDTVCDDVLWNSNTYTIMDCSDNFKKSNEWIYSFKNNKYLPYTDCELSNTNSNVSTSSSTKTDDDEVLKSRIFSSVFNWIPRLNLMSPPLPTVTELTEPNKHSSSNITENSPNLNFFKKSANGWLDNNSCGNQNNNKQKVNISPKLSTLSQRERRRSKVATILNKKSDNKDKDSVYCVSKPNSTPSVGVIENNLSSTDKSNITTPDKVDAESNKDEFDAINPFYSSRKGPMQLNGQPTQSARATSDPMEKLEGNSINTNNNESIDVYDYDLDTVDGSCAQNASNGESPADTLFAAKNVPKATNVTQNATLSNNVPFLHLSFETDFDEDKKSCFKRFYKFINCCK